VSHALEERAKAEEAGEAAPTAGAPAPASATSEA
jgi:hypothetical protein